MKLARRGFLQGVLALFGARIAKAHVTPFRRLSEHVFIEPGEAIGLMPLTPDVFTAAEVSDGWWMTHAAHHMATGYNVGWAIDPDADPEVLQRGVDEGAWTIK